MLGHHKYMQQGNGTALRTRVYIDGYNLYYGCLKNSPHKWLDVRALLAKHAHWTRAHIRDEELAKSQLPAEPTVCAPRCFISQYYNF